MATPTPGIRTLAQTFVAGLALACLAASAGAESKKDETPTEQPPPEPTKPLATSLSATDAALRSAFKEYVGLSRNSEGTVFLTLSKGANLDYAASLAREVWTKTAGEEGKLPNFEFVQAVATPEELNEARLKLRDVLTIKGVVFLDLDEHCGCIVIGAVSKEVNSSIASFIKEHDVYASWVNIVQTPEYRQTAALTDKFRPTMGGQQIRTVANLCTLGLPVYSWDMHNEGILTASHCTQGPLGQNWGTDFYQGPASADFIASESIDLGLFDDTKHPECPTRRFCRFSDAVYAHYGVPDAGIRGRISRPTNMCNWAAFPCLLTLDRPTDDIRIAFATAGMFAGMEVDKIGMTSGWTRGPITNTCVDVNVVEVDASGMTIPTNITMLCQSLVATIAQPGDSGAPVFEYFTGYDAGNFAGILWGANLSYSSMVFSPIDGIEKDLGNFTFDQAGLDASFASDGDFFTSNVDDRLTVKVEHGVVPSDQVEFVLVAAPGISARKDIILEEGWNGLNMRWTIWTSGTVTTARNGLYTYQLPGGFIEFRKRIGNNNNNAMEYVSRVPIDHLAGGTRLTFTWVDD
jgi:hypothetical protein